MDVMDDAWTDAVRAACRVVFTAADAGFVENPGDFHDALLWEADPSTYAARYPSSRVEASYGRSWPPPCIDYWLYVGEDGRHARLAVEGWDEHDIELVLTGDPQHDATAIAAAFARVLRVDDGG